MDARCATLLCATLLCATLLQLIHTGTEAAVIIVQSNSSTNYLVGNNINLTITYNTNNVPFVSWNKDGVSVATWYNGLPLVLNDTRKEIIKPGSLLIYNSTKNDSGNYLVTVTALGDTDGTRLFTVTVYDPVTNVSVLQSPEAVNEKTPAVNLTCSAATGAVTYAWTKDEKSLTNDSSYVTLNGGQILQIVLPNRTHSGNYSCNVSNPVSWNTKTWMLSVSYTDSLSGGAIAGIVIGSICGALLLIGLIVVVIFCIRKRKKGEKEKKLPMSHKEAIRTVSGTTLSPDDPAYFTLNNIMYRSSSISMGSYIMNNFDSTSDFTRNPSPIPPPSQIKVKKATQV